MPGAGGTAGACEPGTAARDVPEASRDTSGRPLTGKLNILHISELLAIIIRLC